jgi:hypothetical protein
MREAYEEFELSPYDDEDEEESGLHNGGYVRDKEDSSREVFIMRGDPYERRVQITDRNGSGWNISPSRLIPVSDSDPAIARYFGESMAEATGDSKFDSMMGDITSPEALNSREALAFMLDLIYHSGASYKEALQQTSTSFEISPAELNALYKKQGLAEGTGQLNIGDPVIISGDVQFKGKTGDVADIGRDGAFVVVDLYNHGKKSFHSSDVSYNDYADSDDEQDMMEVTGDKKFDDMMKRVAKKPTQAQRNAERIRQKKEREAETKAHFANGGGFGPSPADKLSIRKNGVAEGSGGRVDTKPSSSTKKVSEISDNLRNKYVAKASSDYSDANFSARAAKSHPGLEDYSREQEQRAKKRARGLNMALSDRRLGKEGVAEAQDKNKSLPPTTPRNFVAKNAKTGGAGAHKDMKRASKQGDVKHKSRQHDFAESSIGTQLTDIKEGVAETLPMNDAMKVLRKYGADHFKTTSNTLNFYKNGQPFSVDLIWNNDASRSVSLSQLNSATRGLKGQGMAEGSEITEEMIADRLKNELALFKSGTKAKSKDISKKAPDREVQPKTPAKKDSE